MSVFASLWRLARPRAAVLVAGASVVGYFFAHWEQALPLQNAARLPWVLASWFVLHAGTMWLNAALDRDRGEVLFGRATEIPEGLANKGRCALASSVVLAAATDLRVGVCATVAASISLLYSSPKFRWKGHPVLGPCVNAVGYGILSPAAGWLLVGVPLGWRTIVTASAMMATALSVYFLGQVFQAEEDRRRRDRTLVATHGPRAVVTATRLCLLYAGIGVLSLSLIGAFPRSCLLAMPVWFWLERWLVRTSRCEILEEAHVRVFVRRLGLFGLALLLCAMGSYLTDLYVGGPAAGQATGFRVV